MGCNPGYSCDPEYKGRGFLTLSVFFYTLKQKVIDRGFLTLSVFFYTLIQKKRDRGFLPYHPAVMTKHLVNCETETNALLIRLYYTVICTFLAPTRNDVQYLNMH